MREGGREEEGGRVGGRENKAQEMQRIQVVAI